MGKLSAKAGVSFLLAWWVLERIDVGELRAIFRQASSEFLFTALACYFLSLALSTLRSGYYLSDLGIQLRFMKGFRLYLLGAIGNIALPGGVGGDVYKAYRIRRFFSCPLTTILKAYFLERISGLWAIGVWLSVLSFWIPSLAHHGIPILAMFTAISIGYFLIIRRYFPQQAAGLVNKHLLSIGIQGLVSLSVICILYSQDKPFDAIPYLFGFHTSTILSVLNVGLSGLGVREFVMGYSAPWLRNDAALSVFTATVFWIISTVAAIPGLWELWRQNDSKDGEQEMAT